ncbi:uncharacterized protein LOC132830910 [Hemiscyllium ocellatum]|uniref:uncharacterized protein LOC132830910 n=1 Tax=Hemiscyllium ocellatum TaxID=170820 RepID=UPI0029670AB7|nr:uncharacterized protein LOC132830910 [Hemiscyllium ocellatum]
MENPIKIKRTAITLAQKVQIILKLNDPSFKQKEIAREYGLTASAISKIVKKKEEILEEWLRGGNLERKRKREGKNQTIDDALLSWFWTASKEKGPISGPVLMAKAKALAEEMGIEFKPTNGWLCRWKNRNNLAYKRTPKDKSEYRGMSDQWTGFPAFVPQSLYLQDGQLVPDYYRERTATQPLDEAEEDSHDQSAEGAEQEEQDPQFYAGAAVFSPVPSGQHGQWQTMGPGSTDSSSDEMPIAHILIQQDTDTQHKPKRVKQEELSTQSGHNCQFYTAPLDLRSQREMPGTSNEIPATGSQSKGDQIKTEEDSLSHSYQLYKDQQFTSDSSDTSSDEGTLTQPVIHLVTSSHHSVKRIKQEQSPQRASHSYSFYRGPGDLADHRPKARPSDNASDEIMRTRTPIYRTTAGRSKYEQLLQEEESLSKQHQSQSIPSYRGKQTLAQVLQQLGAQLPSRSSYSEPQGSHSFNPVAELSHNQYGREARDDAMSKNRSQFCKGENSCTGGLHSTKKNTAEVKTQEECFRKAELAAICALRNVYFAAKEMIPNSSIEALNELCILQGITDLGGLHLDKLNSYDKLIEEFHQAIAEVTDEGILKRARSSNCFSILIDESEDCFTEPCLYLYLQIIEHVAGGYEPKTYFLAVKKLQEEVTAEKVTAELVNVLKEKDLDVKQMCGFAIDGAAMTAECKNSVVTQLKAQVPGLLSIRCISHRLALSIVSAADTVPYLVKYQQTLNSVYKHCVSFPRDGLEAIQKILRDTHKQSSPFKDILPSRWLTVRASIEAVIRNFGHLVSVLQNSRSAQGVRLAKTMCTYKFLHCSHFLADILHQLYILCKSYQTSNVDFSIVHPLLKSTVTTINKLSAESTGEMLKHLLAALPPNIWEESLSDSSFMFQNHRIKGGRQQKSEAESTCRTFLENLTRDLKGRFSESKDAATMTAMTAIFDPAHASDSKNRHIQTVTDYMSSLSDESDKDEFEMSCKQELVSFMNFVESQPGVHALTSSKDVCELALKQKLMFPVVSSLAERYLVLPISTAGLVETFCRQHMLRTKLGNSLTSKSLENLIKISIHGPPIKEFNFIAAYSKWASGRANRAQQQKS